MKGWFGQFAQFSKGGLLVVIFFSAFILSPSSTEDLHIDMNTFTNVISETAIPQVEAHNSEPTKLSIPAISVDAPIRAMGLTPENRMAVPDNFVDVGWYEYGAHPGEAGSAVLGAHVDNGHAIAGVFKNLKDLRDGDDIYITDSDQVTYHFKVAARKIYNRSETVTDDVFTRNDAAHLNLITCYGTWVPKEKTYDKRLVIFADLVT